MMPESRVAAAVSCQRAAAYAREFYGFEGEVRPLPGEYDDNFKLDTREGNAFVLKVMHPAREPAFVDLQCQALLHLADRAPQLRLPRAVAALDGNLSRRVKLPDGSERLIWMLTFLPGTVLAEANPRGRELLASLGTLLGEVDSALLSFTHPAARRDLKWDICRSLWARDFLPHVQSESRRALAGKFLDLFESEALPRLPQLRRSIIYGDANDFNVLVGAAWPEPRRALSVIDFGDMHETVTVAEPAIAAAYALLRQANPLQAAAAVLAAYHRTFPLREEEIAVFFPLLGARLAVSVVNSAHRQSLLPDDPYVTITEAPAWEALERLASVPPRFAECLFREACGFQAVAKSGEVLGWLAKNGTASSAVIPQNLEASSVLDLSVGSKLLPADPAQWTEPDLTRLLRDTLQQANREVAIGRYDEARPLYMSPLFGEDPNPLAERRSIHLGMDLFVEPGTPVSAPYDGVVHAFANNQAALDYGPVAILRHNPSPGVEFYTLYGHLSADSLASLRIGQVVQQGQAFAAIGRAGENGGWTPHLHFQIILDLLDRSTEFPGVAYASERTVWTALSPDPNLILRIPEARFPEEEATMAQTLEARRALLGRNLSVSYAQPLKIVRGWRQYLRDETGRTFLDVYNNVPLVGHSHPRVVQAVQEQLAVLNTNTRYLHDTIHRYAERLTALLPAPLRVCYFVNSGSEANELALRLARAHTGKEDVIVLEHAYHGHTTALIDISPYKFNGPGGGAKKPWVHVAPIADDFRGIHRRGEANLGQRYAGHVGEICESLQRAGTGVAAFIAETLPSVAGQIVFPPGYLRAAYRHVRDAGGICIADEVQVGFGRLGTHFWGFETQQVVPDVVVLGKPIGNGFPLAAVVTTREIATSFDNGMEFFSTFGGNPVACAAGLAVLDVLRDEQLQRNAASVGSRWMDDLRALDAEHPIVGDVRGAGLFLGVDLVRERETRAPATDQASYIVNRLRDLGILAGTDGPFHNVIKLRPPLIFSDADAQLFTASLGAILEEDAAQTPAA